MNVKQLPRTTVCTLFEIKMPRWKERTVGLALHRVTKHNEVRILYRRKSDGQLTYPDNYYFDGDLLKGLDYEVQAIKGINIVLVPIKDLEILERI